MRGKNALLLGDIAHRFRRWLGQYLLYIAVALVLVTGWVFYDGNPGAAGFAQIALGCFIILATWKASGESVPILPMLAVQHLVAYGLPILVRNEVISNYPVEDLTQSGTEVLIFCCALAGGWRLGMQTFSPARWFCYGLQGFSSDRTAGLRQLGFNLIYGSTGYLILQSTGIIDSIFSFLPSGISILVTTVVAAASSCGFFLVAMLIGSDEISSAARVLFWTTLAVNCLIQASGLLLSAATTVVASVMIGLFWGSGRMPWKYFVIVVAVLAYLSLGKYTMRTKYWHENGDAPAPTLTEIPARYDEWFNASLGEFSGNRKSPMIDGGVPSTENISVFDRVNNLQNLLFVRDAMARNHIPALDGKTYALIPPLFIPRFLWPEKPRTHEGQIILNVHFGRQDLNSTERTFIAWGLLPEAYGNFGPVTGGLLLGLFLGLVIAWLERKTARKLVLSLEGFLLFTVFLGLTNSFEMVGSVLATSLFQGAITVAIAAWPFVTRVDVRTLENAPA